MQCDNKCLKTVNSWTSGNLNFDRVLIGLQENGKNTIFIELQV